MEYLFPFGWGELWGIADRTDYDLKRHQEHSGKDLTYFDQETGEHYVPYVVEPSLGADRMALAFLCDAYDEEVVDAEKNDTRVVLRLHPFLAPPLRLPFCRFPRSWAERRRRFTSCFPNISWWIMTNPVPSGNVTAVRTRSAPLCASPWILKPWATGKSPPTTALPSVTGTAWSRSAFPLTSWSPMWRKNGILMELETGLGKAGPVFFLFPC